VTAIVVLALVAIVALRALTESTPLVAVRPLVAQSVRLQGPAPRIAWPTEGQAAVEVEGLGSLGTSAGGAPAQAPAPIASVAKVMTAYLTLRNDPLPTDGSDGFVMTVTRADVADWRARLALGQSTVAVRAGERMTERQALEALMLPSANNIAAMLAERSASGTGGFVEQMNATARQLGMRSTTYTDPSGFDETTVSTASDQVRLARAALRVPGFTQIASEPSAVLPVAGEVTNFNALVGHNGYIGIKTGSDSAAGGCLVFAKRFTVAGRHLTVVGAVLGQRDGSLIPAALESAQRLGDSAAAAVRQRTVVAKGQRVLLATGTDDRQVAIVAKRPLREIGWGGMRVPVRITQAPPTRELSAGQQVAVLSTRGLLSPRVGAAAERELGKPSLGWRLRHLL
jgi:D-alanyl-D-alanine carboxypeptidase (penicillin-binding protein 5/6)